MAGLAAAVRLRELGIRSALFEKGTRPGGSMLLSSCVIWRYREWDTFRCECPDGDPALQRAVWEQLDDALAWLESLGAPVVWQETGNPATIGKRFDPRGLRDVLVRAAGDVTCTCPYMDMGQEHPCTILATGGFQGDAALVAEHIGPERPLRLRANPWSAGDGLRHAIAHGGALSAGMEQFYGRNMPDTDFGEADFVSQAQLYGRYARVFNDAGEEFFTGEVSWSENDLVQATARQPNARAWYVLDDVSLAERVRERNVADMVAAAPTRVAPSELPFRAPGGARVAVRVSPGITHTIGGIRIDEHARVVDDRRAPIGDLYAAGADAGGISTGGYASGLAAALVFGRIAAETVADA
jgi:succinate dehydrogenase/fumarate reductase flavoprotein subunit